MISVQRKNSLAGLAPKSGFVTAQSVKRVARQIGQTQKTLGEVWRAGVRIRLRDGYLRSVLRIWLDSLVESEGKKRRIKLCCASRFLRKSSKCRAWISNRPVPIVVARRIRQSRLASRSPSPRSTADCASKSAVTAASKAL